uniref:Oxidoreductase, short chain dehydrogenase/reductase family protein n=2 Tax=Ascaris TaxID=6251 RepID=A0A0M3INC4_ASCLU
MITGWLWWLLGIYVAYRLTRTMLALIRAVLIYWIAPIFYEPNLNKYKGRWTVVTGGTDGIGKAYMIELAKRGLRKFVIIGRNPTKLNDVKASLEMNFGADVQTYLFDFFDGDYEALREYLNKIDIGFVVNSVGVGRELMERYGDNPEADRSILKINAMGSAEFLSMVLPPMERNGGGQIVVMSSILSYRPFPYLAAYCAAKSMISFLCESVDREWSTIDVQCLTPAIVATNMTFYKEASFFVITPEYFARQAVNTIGLVKSTTGSFLHEIQDLARHLYPWRILKYLILPICYYQRWRADRLCKERGDAKIDPSLKRAQA